MCVLPIERVAAQSDGGSLQPGIPVERTVARGQTHRFTVSLEKDQFLQLVVMQRGIDVVVRAFSPDGKSLGEFDSPNGTDGPENVSVVAETTGVYRFEVVPLDHGENVSPGRYEIKILDLRRATEQEIQEGKNRESLKAKGLALLVEAIESLKDIRLPQTRVHAQMQAAQLLWSSDETNALRLVADAIDAVKEYLTSIDLSDQDYYQTFEMAVQLRQEVLSGLAPHDPERALSFLRSTHIIDPETGTSYNQLQDLQLELSLANRIAETDPKRALEIAEETLKRGVTASITDTLFQLRNKDPEAAAKLAHEIAAKLQEEKLVKNPDATMLALNLLRLAKSPVRGERPINAVSAAGSAALLSDQEYRDLLHKLVTAGLSYSPSSTNSNTPERYSAQNILNSLKSMTSSLEVFEPGSAAAVEKRASELSAPPNQGIPPWQSYQNTVNNGSFNEGLEAASKAPKEIRDQLYQQLAGKAAAEGDFSTARQILMDHVSNPAQRRQALSNLDQQAINNAVARGKMEEALRGIGGLRTTKERAIMLSQIVSQIGAGQKRATALNLLEMARSIVGSSVQAEDQEQMNAIFEIGRAFSRYDSRRGFEIVEPLIEQFNEISSAARTLNGFGQQYYQDGELIMQNGNSVANLVNQLTVALGSMGLANFDRARTAADRIRQPEVRIGVYLAMAEQAIQGPK